MACFLKIVALVFVVGTTFGLNICERRYKRINCYKEKQNDVLFNNRRNINWKKFPEFLHELACLCQEEALKKGYKYFALRYHGICVGYNELPPPKDLKLDGCINNVFKSCQEKNEECVGGGYEDMLYEVGEDGGFGPWSGFSECSTTCDVGRRIRIRKCDRPKPKGNGVCKGVATQSRFCFNKRCPGNAFGGGGHTGGLTGPGKLSEWTDFGPCSVTCGKGIQTRYRECNKRKCRGDTEETRLCLLKDCDVDDLGSWSECSVTCGKGFQYRTECVARKHGKCSLEERVEMRRCEEKKCPVDGKYGEWSSYTTCDRTCGGGLQIRTRKCDSPPPQFGGKKCAGESEEEKYCGNEFCPGAGGIETVQEVTKNVLKKAMVTFGNHSGNETKKHSKKLQALLDIQGVVGNEFSISRYSQSRKSPQKRLDDLEKYLKIAVQAGNMPFARSTFGKALYTAIQLNLEAGVPIHELEKKTSEYISNVTSEIGESKWQDITASQDVSTLAFVVDTTGSMRNEITAARNIAKFVANSNKTGKLDYILSAFNDPVIGPVTHRTSAEAKTFLKDLGSLKAKGGFDCPEPVFKGIIKAFDQKPKFGSPVFVFTDASPKDDTPENIAAVKLASRRYDSKVIFFANKYGCTGGDKRGIDSFHEVAKYTAGEVYDNVGSKTSPEFHNIVLDALRSDAQITSGAITVNPHVRTRRDLVAEPTHFAIDDALEKLILFVETDVPHALHSIYLNDPTGKKVSHTQVIGLQLHYEIHTPVSGRWHLYFPDIAGTYKYKVSAISFASLESASNFLFKDEDDFSVQSQSPMADQENEIMVRLAGDYQISMESLRVDVVREDGRLSREGLEVTADSNYMFRTRFVPPYGDFRLKLRGVTVSGAPFERLSGGSSRATKLIVKTLDCGDEFTVEAGQTNVEIKLQVFIQGESHGMLVMVRGQAYLGNAHGQDQKTIANQGVMTIRYNAPTGLQKGASDQIRIRACPGTCFDDETINSENNHVHTFAIMIV